MHDTEHQLFTAHRELAQAARSCEEQAARNGNDAATWATIADTVAQLSELVERLAGQSHSLEWEPASEKRT